MRLLEKHFEIALETTDGIQKLRALILELAIQGKLVNQKIEEQSAEMLIHNAKLMRTKLINKGKFKNNKYLDKNNSNSRPFKLPYNWVWTTLSTLGEINPRNNADDKVAAGFVPMTLIFNEYGKRHEYEEKTWGEIRKGFTHFQDNDVVLAKITPCFENGKSCIIKGLPNKIGAGTTELHVFRNSLSATIPEYVLAYLKSPFFFRNGVPKMTGTAGQKRVPTEYFALSPFPLPPLAEQKRIVDKIDQLMSLCDKLETQRNERNNKRLKINVAAKNNLLSAKDNVDFNKSWHFITKNFDEIYSVPENVAELKKVILQLAVMGKLVPQDSKDQPASELLKEIESEKKRLVKEGKIKEQKPLPPIMPEDMPYELPSRWMWVRLGEIADVIRGVTYAKNQSRDIAFNDSIELLRANNIGDTLNYNNTIYIPFNLVKNEQLLKNGDVLIALSSGSPHLVGKAVQFTNNRICTFGAFCGVIRTFSKSISQYLYLYCTSPLYRDQTHKHGKGIGIQNLSKESLHNILFILPPLSEQKRIIAKIDQLFFLCDSLEKSIKYSTMKKADILNAVLARI